jgi:hypothetical protein
MKKTQELRPSLKKSFRQLPSPPFGVTTILVKFSKANFYVTEHHIWERVPFYLCPVPKFVFSVFNFRINLYSTLQGVTIQLVCQCR